MWQNILIILIIILFSYIFTFKDKKYFDLQMLFILLSLFSIVIYKLMFLKTLKINENYTNNDTQNDVNAFADPTNISTSDKVPIDNSANMSQLIQDMNALKMELENIQIKGKKTGDTNGQFKGSTPINESITHQDMEIKKLEILIDDLKEKLFFTNEEQSKKTYKKIKVFNSCEPIPTKSETETISVVKTPEIVNTHTTKNDFFKILLDKLNATGFKLNLNLV